MLQKNDGGDFDAWLNTVFCSTATQAPIYRSHSLRAVPVVSGEGHLAQFNRLSEEVEGGFALARSLFRGKV
jgi:hypothetical protein